MKAIMLRKFGEPNNFKMETLPDPRPDRGELLIKVRACGVCYHDIIMRRGKLPGTSVPAVLGHEVVGEVIEVGMGVTGWKVGDRAATLQRMSCGDCDHCKDNRPSLCKIDRRFFGEEIYGGYSTMMTAPARGLCHVPDGLSWEDAAVACCTIGTAVHVCRIPRPRQSAADTVLITGASGGVGIQAVQLCKLDGARVIAVTSNEAKVAALKKAGADHVVVSPDLKFGKAVREVAGGEGVNIALEIVGAQTFDQTLKCMAPAGHASSSSATSTRASASSIRASSSSRSSRSSVRTRRHVKSLETAFARSWPKAKSTCRTSPKSYRSRKAAQAHFRLENREVTGRLVLVPPSN